MDELVASAVSHWAPRFTTNGVAVADFERVVGGLKDWDGWCPAWSAVGAEYEALGAEAVREGRLRSAGQHYVQAAVCHHFGKFLFVQDPVQMREAHLAAVRCLDAALPYLDPPGRRIEIPFEGSRLVGVLRLPHGPGPHPVVVMVPGLDSAKEEFRSTEELFLERGVGTFSVDGPGQGEAEYDLPIRGDWEVPGGAILDAVSAEPDIDPDRLAVWGVSLGGYYAPRIASGDSRVGACVALAGPYDFGECWGQLPDLTRRAFRARSRAESDEHAREIAHTLSLEGRTGSITCPLLVVTGRLDRLIPWQHASRLAEEAGETARLLLLDDGNHGCMNVAAKHRQKTADWVAAHLGAGK
ncbi:alpha/beta hydrolase [Nonomuraea sp. B12E4]|uniref:alpha/beta hydrolase family protein n=1 Tax=Nonomuraea sp. B12E4 TaxID=3153564 RepID=UPI00325ED12E